MQHLSPMMRLSTIALALLALGFSAVAAQDEAEARTPADDSPEMMPMTMPGMACGCMFMSADADMKVEELEDGLGVRMTSDNPQQVQILQKTGQLLVLRQDIQQLRMQQAEARGEQQDGRGMMRGGQPAGPRSFDQADADNDDKITRDEVGRAERWQQLMEYDEDGDEALNEDEWQAAHEELQPPRRGMMRDGMSQRRGMMRDGMHHRGGRMQNPGMMRQSGMQGRGPMMGRQGAMNGRGMMHGSMNGGRHGLCPMMMQKGVSVSAENIDNGVLLKFTAEDSQQAQRLQIIGKLHEEWRNFEKTLQAEADDMPMRRGMMAARQALHGSEVSVENTDDGVQITIVAPDDATRKQVQQLAQMAKLMHQLRSLDKQN